MLPERHFFAITSGKV